jgi:hypothetical protein
MAPAGRVDGVGVVFSALMDNRLRPVVRLFQAAVALLRAGFCLPG